MKIKYVGEIIRQRRKNLGLSQKMVSNGLCAIMTLSRLESNQQTPSWECVSAMLQRLGLPDDQICIHLTKPEMRRMRLRKEVSAHCGRFEQTKDEEREQARAQALEKLHELEHSIKERDRINRQFIIRMRATLETHPVQTQLDMLIDALRLTSPKCDLDELNKCLYCADEVVIINKIAINYFRCGQTRKAFDIYGQLLKLVQKRTPNHKYLPLITYNYARDLGIENRLKESLEIAEIGRQACIKLGYYYVLPRFLHMEAECYYLMGEDGKSLERYRSAYYTYGATKDTRNQEILRNDVRERFNLVL